MSGSFDIFSLKRDHNKTSESIESAKLRKKEEKANLLFRTLHSFLAFLFRLHTLRCCLHGKINVYESNALPGKVIATSENFHTKRQSGARELQDILV